MTVILTKEQAELVETLKKNRDYDKVLKRVLLGEEIPNRRFWPLSELSFNDLMSVFIDGYAIKQPKIGTGDWVKIKELFTPVFNDGRNEEAYKLERIFKVKEVVLGGKVLCPDHYVHYPENLCHATKEEIFWAELGRGVGEFREGDGYMYDTGQLFEVGNGEHTQIISKKYKEKCLTGFYPAESFKRFPTGNES